MSGVYLDYNASALTRPEVQAEVAKALAERARAKGVEEVVFDRGGMAEIVREGGGKVAVGYDGRLSSPELEPQLVAGLRACGLEVLRQAPDVRTVLVPTGGGGGDSAEQGRLLLGLGDLVGIGGDDVIDRLFDGARVGDLLQAVLLHHFGRRALAVPDVVKHLLGDLGGDHALLDQLD